MGKPFFYRIEAGALIDFATDPEGEDMTLLKFAKELQKGQSDIKFIQDIIDEAYNYIEKKRKAGSAGGLAKSSSAKAVLEHCHDGALANPSTPLASSSSSNSSSTETKKEPKPLSQDAVRLASDLADCVVRNIPTHSGLNNGKRDKTIQSWAKEIDYMNRIDGRSWNEIAAMIQWSQSDDFWKKIILSGKKLRAQYDTMFARMRPTATIRKQEIVF